MRPARSVASRVFVVLLIATLVVGGLVAVFLVSDAQRATHVEAERVTAATAVTLAASPLVTEALDAGDATFALEMANDKLRVDLQALAQPYSGQMLQILDDLIAAIEQNLES